MDYTDWPHVVIVGGGFGGLYTTKALQHAPVRVTLVDRRNFHLFQPLLSSMCANSHRRQERTGAILTFQYPTNSPSIAMAEAIGTTRLHQASSSQCIHWLYASAPEGPPLPLVHRRGSLSDHLVAAFAYGQATSRRPRRLTMGQTSKVT